MEANKEILSTRELAIMEMLCKNGQGHIFKNWSGPGKDDAQKHELLEQLEKTDKSYPGGLISYIENARMLLKDTLVGINPFDGWSPRVPKGERLKFGSKQFDTLENAGAEELGSTGFVLVAGGLGERLGYSGIKISLPIETSTETCFLEYYIRNILTFQRNAQYRTKRRVLLPLAIMTSGDTHQRTIDLLKENNNFGMEPEQITLMQQEKVPALSDNNASFCLKSPYVLMTKPHGHGDVHALMQQHGVAKQWMSKLRIKWILFFQDTNGVVFRGLPAALGVSKENEFAMNSITVPRRPAEAVGGIATLINGDRMMTVNVEYNQLGPMLKNTGNRKGDVADRSGYSPFPGNCNVFILEISTYCKILESSGGLMPEFVNPKFKDRKKTVFKKPTRLECMMQDYPKLLGADIPVGITQGERFYCLEPVKNNIQDAKAKQRKNGIAESAATGEFAIYKVNRRYLEEAGVKFDSDEKQSYSGISVPYSTRVVLFPAFGVTLKEVKDHIHGEVDVTAESTLILDGDIDIYNLQLDGALLVKACPGAKVTIKNLTVKNKGIFFKSIDPEDDKIPEKYRIRGYTPKRRDILELKFVVPGQYVVDDSKTLKSIVL